MPVPASIVFPVTCGVCIGVGTFACIAACCNTEHHFAYNRVIPIIHRRMNTRTRPPQNQQISMYQFVKKQNPYVVILNPDGSAALASVTVSGTGSVSGDLQEGNP